MTEDEIIRKAGKLFDRQDKLKAQMMDLDNEIRELCRDYGNVMKVWGWSPQLLRRAVNLRSRKAA